MADNLSIEAPLFDQVRTETGVATHDAIKLLWDALNYEMGLRRQGVRVNQERFAPKVISDAPTANQDNYMLTGASILLLTGSTNVDFTGFIAPSTGESHILYVHNIGSATITMKHASASSDADNRLRLQSLADTTIGQDRSMILQYLSSLWRELKLV